VNPVGVPDINAVLRLEGTAGQYVALLDKLEQWHPTETKQQDLREHLLRQSEETLQALRDILS
jgi:hypothetical protein